MTKKRTRFPFPKGYDWKVSGYLPTGHGVYRVNKDGGTGEQITFGPIFPIGVLRDTDGEEMVKLCWRHRDKIVVKNVPREVCKQGKRLVREYGMFGLPCVESRGSGLEVWLEVCERANEDVIPEFQVARQIGWTKLLGGGRQFIPGPNWPGLEANGSKGPPVEPKSGLSKRVVDGYRSKGSLADWQRVVKEMEPFEVACVPLFASFAAPLLEVLGLDSFTLDVYGETTKGKTTAARVALSVWGDPERTIATWNDTQVAIAKRLGLASGVPVVLDESSVVTWDSVVKDVLYAIPAGEERGRGNRSGGMQHRETWRTIVITTGEKSICEFTKDGGTAARVVPCEGEPFGDSGSVAVSVGAGVDACYGTAGWAYLQKVVALGAEEVKERYGDILGQLRFEGRLAKRRAPMVAALALAAELAAEVGVLPFSAPPVAWWHERFGQATDSDNRPEDAREVVRAWVLANSERIRETGAVAQQPSQGWAGKHVGPNVARVNVRAGTVALFPVVVERVLKESGYDLHAVRRAWLHRGWLVPDREGRDTPKVRFSEEFRSPPRMFVFDGLLGSRDVPTESSRG